jgi:hypothetical protein
MPYRRSQHSNLCTVETVCEGGIVHIDEEGVELAKTLACQVPHRGECHVSSFSATVEGVPAGRAEELAFRLSEAYNGRAYRVPIHIERQPGQKPIRHYDDVMLAPLTQDR